MFPCALSSVLLWASLQWDLFSMMGVQPLWGITFDPGTSKFSWLTYMSGSGCWKAQAEEGVPWVSPFLRGFSVILLTMVASGYLDWLLTYTGSGFIRCMSKKNKPDGWCILLRTHFRNHTVSTFTKWIEWSCHKTLPSFKGMEHMDLKLISGRNIKNILRGTFGMRYIYSCSALWNIWSTTVIYVSEFQCYMSGQPEVNSQIRLYS